jgi:hypothetical protein
MRAAEIIRALMDLVDNQKDGPEGNVAIDSTTKRMAPVTIDNENGAKKADAMHNTDGQKLMVPPLQQKLDLLKKISDDDQSNDEDELSRIKKLAIAHEAGEDNDILG